MIPDDKTRVNVTMVPATVERLDRLARYWRVHRSTVIAAAVNAGLPVLRDMRNRTRSSPDRGKSELRDLAATQLELPLHEASPGSDSAG